MPHQPPTTPDPLPPLLAPLGPERVEALTDALLQDWDNPALSGSALCTRHAITPEQAVAIMDRPRFVRSAQALEAMWTAREPHYQAFVRALAIEHLTGITRPDSTTSIGMAREIRLTIKAALQMLDLKIPAAPTTHTDPTPDHKTRTPTASARPPGTPSASSTGDRAYTSLHEPPSPGATVACSTPGHSTCTSPRMSGITSADTRSNVSTSRDAEPSPTRTEPVTGPSRSPSSRTINSTSLEDPSGAFAPIDRRVTRQTTSIAGNTGPGALLTSAGSTSVVRQRDVRPGKARITSLPSPASSPAASRPP